MDREVLDKDVIVAQTRQVQKIHKGEIEKASYDRGFHSEENAKELSKILAPPCLPIKHHPLKIDRFRHEIHRTSESQSIFRPTILTV